MKTFISIMILAGLLSTSSQAQSGNPTKIHFLNAIAGGFLIPEIKTSPEDKSSITLKSRTWHLIQTTSDSVGFYVDNTPYYLHFEPGKQYYFVIQTSYNSRPVVTEKSEREFILTAMIESIKGPEIHILGKVNN